MYFLTDGEVSARHRIRERRVHRPSESHDFVLLSETDIRLQQGESVGLTEVKDQSA